MPKRLISLFIVAVFALSGPAVFAMVYPGNAPQLDLLELLPESLADDLHERGICDLNPVGVTVGGQESSVAPFANARAEQRCMLPVPPRDIFENIARAR